ncbi:hypothetical protein NKR23_g7035 [Pleurostoma richardsiae]|uniref:Uncharacterized protein n=1 Tax=Pleurostoma richardsiae TaxID=41990 RepID=A0AA38RMQ0_9PEZI|nr:hypothetical protein NKR23_g7035 [Pleurostoma richardsiae]
MPSKLSIPFSFGRRSNPSLDLSSGPAQQGAQPPPSSRRSSDPTHARAAATTPSHADDLPLTVQDAIVAEQWTEHLRQQQQQQHGSASGPATDAPLPLYASTLVAAGVCDSARDAETVRRALLGAGLLRPDDGGTPHTGAVEPAGLPRLVRVLSVPACKVLLRVLFFWEDEVVRLRRYADEEAQLREALRGLRGERTSLGDEDEGEEEGEEAGGDGEGEEAVRQERREERERLDKMIREVEFRIKAVALRKRVLPSRRGVEDELPRYDAEW